MTGVIAVQFGGRLRYAMPAALARAGRLARLYTDLCAGQGLGRLAPLAAPMVDLANRRPPPEVLARTRSFPLWHWEIRQALRDPDPEARVTRLLAAHDRAARAMVAEGFGRASHVVTMMGEGLGLAEAARARGLTVASDMVVMPSAERIVAEEQARHPDWELPRRYFGEAHGLIDRVIGASDLFLCPSEAVADDLAARGVARSRLRLVPYLVPPGWEGIRPRTVPGRVLFVGSADLRKGIHVLASAAGRLWGAQVHVVGAASDQVRRLAPHLTFRGRLTGTALRTAFAEADLLVCPSLAEGSAGVTYEAMAAGLPVIATREAGSVMRHGMEGLVVPTREPDALAEAMARILRDRPLRDQMSVAARARAGRFGPADHGRRLIAALFGAEAGRAAA